jgi:hypothetical protein
VAWVARKMTVALSRSGDKGDSAPAAGVAPVCPSPALRLPQRAAAGRGSRFWALAGDSSDNESAEFCLFLRGGYKTFSMQKTVELCIIYGIMFYKIWLFNFCNIFLVDTSQKIPIFALIK